jgi:hypothetical protein
MRWPLARLRIGKARKYANSDSREPAPTERRDFNSWLAAYRASLPRPFEFAMSSQATDKGNQDDSDPHNQNP